MTKDEALKLALEALEGLFGIPDYWTSEGGGGVAVWRLGGSDAPRQAITAIKEALARPEQPDERNFCPRCGKLTKDIHTCTPPKPINWVDHEPT